MTEQQFEHALRQTVEDWRRLAVELIDARNQSSDPAVRKRLGASAHVYRDNAITLENLIQGAPAPEDPLLGLATTRQLLEELDVRGRLEGYYNGLGLELSAGAQIMLEKLPGSMLGYRTVDGPPELQPLSLEAQVERLADELHARHAHPDFEYATTQCGRKETSSPPPGGGWVPNVHGGDPHSSWERYDYHEDHMWRRPRPKHHVAEAG